MGSYLVSVGAADWFDQDEDGLGQTAAALNAALAQRGLPPYESVPAAGQAFEEKLVPARTGFEALCAAHLSAAETGTLCGWTILVPFAVDPPIELPIESSYTPSTVVAGAPQALPIARRLADVIELPAATPSTSDNLDLTTWFLDGAAKRLGSARPGPWSADLDTAFYVALFLRAAQHSLRSGCPMSYT
jgi:hypothetical protein